MIFQGGGWMRPEHLELDTEEDDERPVATMDLHLTKVEDNRPRDAFRREAALRIAAERGAVSSMLLARECGISEELARRQLVAPSLGCYVESEPAAVRDTCCREALRVVAHFQTRENPRANAGLAGRAEALAPARHRGGGAPRTSCGIRGRREDETRN